MSVIMQRAFETYEEMRAAYDEHLAMSFERAETACKGVLLNQRGTIAGISPISLFYGNEARAYAYASDELIEHWEQNPRMNVAMFEQQWFAGREWTPW